MKFDIVKYIDDVCQSYLLGRHTKAYVLSVIDLTLAEDSWQRLCDGKEVVSDDADNVDDIKINGGIIKSYDNTWRVPSDWCIEDSEDDE